MFFKFMIKSNIFYYIIEISYIEYVYCVILLSLYITREKLCMMHCCKEWDKILFSVKTNTSDLSFFFKASRLIWTNVGNWKRKKLYKSFFSPMNRPVRITYTSGYIFFLLPGSNFDQIYYSRFYFTFRSNILVITLSSMCLYHFTGSIIVSTVTFWRKKNPLYSIRVHMLK